MKKILLILFVLASLSGFSQAILVDSYPESNQSSENNLTNYPGGAESMGGNFTVVNTIFVDSTKFYLKKVLTPNNKIFSKIYNHTGTYGTDGKPTGAYIAVSGELNSVDLSTSFAVIKFTYSGANQIKLTPGYYVAQMQTTNDAALGNYVTFACDNSSPAHSGNRSNSTDLATWSATNVVDVIFYVYGHGLIKNISGKARNNTHKKVAGVAAASIKKVQTLTY